MFSLHSTHVLRYLKVLSSSTQKNVRSYVCSRTSFLKVLSSGKKKRSSEYQLLLKLQVERSLWAKIGAQTPNLQGAITHTWHVCSQHSFGLPLRVNGEHKTQVTRSRTFGPSIDLSLIT